MRYNKLVQKNKITEVFPMNIISHFYKYDKSVSVKSFGGERLES